MQFFFHALLLRNILDNADDNIFGSLSRIQIAPYLQPPETAICRYSTKFHFNGTIILQYIFNPLFKNRQIFRNDTHSDILQILHSFHSGISEHTEKTIIDKNRREFPVLILKETDTGNDIVYH